MWAEHADVKFEKDSFMLGSSSTLKVYQFINLSLSYRARPVLGVDLYFFLDRNFPPFLTGVDFYQRSISIWGFTIITNAQIS